MIDPRNGEILALASTPDLRRVDHRRPDDGRAPHSRPCAPTRPPLLPRSTLGRYVPGSVFKVVTAIAGLGSGAVTPATTYESSPCRGGRARGRRFRSATVTTRRPGTGRSTSSVATEASCNIWYALTGLQTGAPMPSASPSGWASGHRSRSTCRPLPRRSTTAPAAARRLRRRRGACQRGLRPGRDLRDADPDGARRGDRRERRRVDGAAPRHGYQGRGSSRPIGERPSARVIDAAATAISAAMVPGRRGRSASSSPRAPRSRA